MHDADGRRPLSLRRYFSHSSQLSVASWTTDETGALDPCGHCDNCTRPREALAPRDVTLATWQILKVVEAVRQTGTKLTLGQLVVLARGGKKGAYEVKKGRKKEQTTLDLERVAGGPVEMSKFVRFLPGLLRPCHAHRAFSCRTWSTCSCIC